MTAQRGFQPSESEATAELATRREPTPGQRSPTRRRLAAALQTLVLSSSATNEHSSLVPRPLAASSLGQSSSVAPPSRDRSPNRSSFQPAPSGLPSPGKMGAGWE